MRRSLPPLRPARDRPRLSELLRPAPPAAFAAARAELEAAFATANGGGALLLPTGRAALRGILQYLARPGRRRVVLPAYTDTSLLETVRGLGLEPIACDVRRRDGVLDAERLDALLAADVLAVVVIHLFGRPAALDAIAARAAAHGVAVVEDCAHAPLAPFGAAARRRVAASFTSLAPFKLVDCGGGGIAFSTDAALIAALRHAAPPAAPCGAPTALSRLAGAAAVALATAPALYDRLGHRAFARLGAGGGAMPFYKRHIRPILKRGADHAAADAVDEAAVLPSLPFLRAGLRQFASLPARLAERRRLARRLAAGLPEGLLLAAEPLDQSCEYAQIAVVADRAAALARLAAAGVDALPSPMIAWADPAACPVAAHLAAHAIQLPWFDGLSDADVDLLRHALLHACD